MNAISSPAEGLLIFNTQIKKFFYYNGSNWGQSELSSNSLDTIQENHFTAKIQGDGTIESQNVNWIQNVNRSSAGTFDITFKTGLFSEAPMVVATVGASKGGHIASKNNLSNTGVTIYVTNNLAIAVNKTFSVIASRQGADYIVNDVGAFKDTLTISPTDTAKIISDSDRGTQVSVADESNIIFTTGAAESARINATGFIGINNNNPTNWLDLDVASSNTGLQLRGDFEPGIKLDACGTKGKQWEIFSASGATSEGQGSLIFYDRDSAVSRMSIDTVGNVRVGIKPAAPYHKFSVSSDKIGGLFRLNQENATLGSEISFFINDNFKWSLGGSEDSYTLGESFFYLQ